MNDKLILVFIAWNKLRSSNDFPLIFEFRIIDLILLKFYLTIFFKDRFQYRWLNRNWFNFIVIGIWWLIPISVVLYFQVENSNILKCNTYKQKKFKFLKNLFNRKAKREEEIQFEFIARQFEKYSAYEAFRSTIFTINSRNKNGSIN